MALPAIALFLQFKLSHRLERATARHAFRIGLPYYRFELRPLKHSDQHNLLLALERAANLVYYAAPEFHRTIELNEAFATRTVVARSAFFKPSDIGALPDNDEHYVAFRVGSIQSWMFSEPRPLERHSFHDVFETDLAARLGSSPHLASTDFFTGIANTLLDAYERAQPKRQPHIDLGALRSSSSLSDPARYAQFLSLILFGCQLLVLVGSP